MGVWEQVTNLLLSGREFSLHSAVTLALDSNFVLDSMKQQCSPICLLLVSVGMLSWSVADDSKWYAGIGGESEGPFPISKIREMVAGKEVKESTLLWKEGMAEWEEAGDLAILAESFAPPEIPSVEPPSAKVTVPPAAADKAPLIPPPLEEPAWFVEVDGKPGGPFRVSNLREMIDGEKLSSESLVWKEGMADWVELDSLPILAIHLPEDTEPLRTAPTAKPNPFATMPIAEANSTTPFTPLSKTPKESSRLPKAPSKPTEMTESSIPPSTTPPPSSGTIPTPAPTKNEIRVGSAQSYRMKKQQTQVIQDSRSNVTANRSGRGVVVSGNNLRNPNINYGDAGGGFSGIPAVSNELRVPAGASVIVASTGSNLVATDAKSLMDYHNRVRKEVGVPELLWSQELAVYAQEWADRIANTGKLEHRPQAQQNYGENLAIGTTGYYTILNLAESWYKEKPNYIPGTPFSEATLKAGHYTQMVWKGSSVMGAGIAYCRTGKLKGMTILVCNYAARGNVIGQRPF